MGTIEVVFHPSFNFDVKAALAGADASPEFIENTLFKWNHVALSPNAHKRLRELAETVGGRLIESGIAIEDVSPMRWRIVTYDPDDIIEFMLRLECARFGRVDLTVELLLDESDNLPEFLIGFLEQSARRKAMRAGK